MSTARTASNTASLSSPSGASKRDGSIDYVGIVERFTEKRLRAFKRTKEEGDNPYESLRRMTLGTAAEYEGRFLFELIQNASDAHRKSHPGVTHVLLDRSAGAHGTVYVANTGSAFTESNFTAISSLAQSDKDPGENIGSKGIGFKSVIEISKWPEIYSAASSERGRDEFRGFCFGFARDADLRHLVRGDEARFRELRTEMSRYLLPVPLGGQDDVVRAFATAGMATVIRLPLDDEAALMVVEETFDELRHSEAPVMLFLPRLRRLVLEIRGDSGRDQAVELTREVTEVDAGEPTRVSLEQVDLAEAGQFLLARMPVHPARVKESLAKSIEAEQLDEQWANLGLKVQVEVAVRTDGQIGEGAMYTFLPMSQAAPFLGHVNAPFVTKLARTAVSEAIPLNALLMDEVGELCARTLLLLSHLGSSYARRAALDLLSWTETSAPRLEEAFTRIGHSLREEAIVPTVGPGGRETWSSLDGTTTWTEDFEILSASAFAVAASVDVADPAAGHFRAERLETFASALGLETAPDVDQVAQWAELVAARLPRASRSIRSWDTLYEEIATYFDRSEEALEGRRLLLDEDEKLRLCGRRRDPAAQREEPVVFFQPREQASDEDDIDADVDVSIPPNLKQTVSYMHPKLTWYDQEGSIRRARRSRKFFGDARLVQPYKTHALLDHVAQVLRATNHHLVHQAALRWIYSLKRAARLLDPEAFAAVPVRLPTHEGWRPARTAFFGRGWSSQVGEAIEDLADSPSAPSPPLAALSQRLLRPPDEWPFDLENRPGWRAFLTELGVREGLWPIDRPGGGTILAGLDDHPGLPLGKRKAFAYLVISTLGVWSSEEFEAYRGALGSTQWLPVVAEEGLGRVTFCRPDQGWHLESTERPLRGAPMLTPALRRVLDSQPEAVTRLRELGLGIWGRPEDAGRVVTLLGDLLEQDLVEADDLRSFRRRYAEAWRQVGETGGLQGVETRDTLPVVVSRGAKLEVVVGDLARGELSEPIYVGDQGGSLAERLLHGLDRPILETGESGGAEVVDVLRDLFGEEVRATSETDVEILLDGERFSPDTAAPTLVDESRAWLPVLIGCVMEFARTPFFRGRGHAAREKALNALRRVRLRRGSNLKLAVDGREATAPPAIAIPDERHPTLILGAGIEMTIPGLGQLAPQIAELTGLELLEAEIEVALLRLAEVVGSSEGESPLQDSDIAAALDIDVSHVAETRRWVEGAVQSLVQLLLPVVAYAVDVSAALHFEERAAPASAPEDLVELLAPHAGRLPTSPRRLVGLGQEFTELTDLRDELGLDFAAFNATLRELGPPYRPDVDEAAQRRAFEAFKQGNRERILGSLRLAYVSAFRSRKSLERYVAARGLEALDPDPEWLESTPIPSEEQMTQRVDQWLAGQDAPQMRNWQDQLAAIDEVRAVNTRLIDELEPRLRRVVLAWCRKNRVDAPARWRKRDGAQVREFFAKGGMLDFEVLDSTSVIDLLCDHGAWPQDMPPTDELSPLGLQSSDLEQIDSERESETRQREFERQSISLDGERILATRDNYAELIERVQGSISEDLLECSTRIARLAEVPDAGPRRHPGGGGGGGRRRQPNDTQREAIGLVGEVAAFEWLRHQYPDMTSDGWRSSYKEFLFAGEHGDDSLGYDFETVHKSGSIFFEVKASGEETQFKMGESQLDIAQRLARTTRYRILFVHHALEAPRRRIYVLPNPFSDRGRRLFRTAGQGIGYRFRLPR